MKAIGEKGSRVERLTPGERDKIHQPQSGQSSLWSETRERSIVAFYSLLKNE